MGIRELTLGDMPAVERMLRESLDLDLPDNHLIKEKLLDDADMGDDLRLVLEHGDHLAGLGAAVTRGGSVAYIKVLAVNPRFQGMGYGARLLIELESRLKGRARTVRLGEGAPNYWWPGVDVGYTRAMIFFERYGYKKFDQTYNLEVSLAQLPDAPLLPNTVSARRAETEDREAMDTFLEGSWQAWKGEIHKAFEQDPIPLHLGFVNGTLAAFSAHNCNNLGTGWFGPMGTAAAARGQGLGRLLLLRCLEDIRDAGHRRAVIPWVGPVGFYAKAVNARVARVFFRYEKQLA